MEDFVVHQLQFPDRCFHTTLFFPSKDYNHVWFFFLFVCRPETWSDRLRFLLENNLILEYIFMIKKFAGKYFPSMDYREKNYDNWSIWIMFPLLRSKSHFPGNPVSFQRDLHPLYKNLFSKNHMEENVFQNFRFSAFIGLWKIFSGR